MVMMLGYVALHYGPQKPAAICGGDMRDKKETMQASPIPASPQKSNSKTCDEITLVPLPLVDRPVPDNSCPQIAFALSPWPNNPQKSKLTPVCPWTSPTGRAFTDPRHGLQ